MENKILSQEEQSALLKGLYASCGIEFFYELLLGFPGVDRRAYTVDEVRTYEAESSTWKGEKQRLLTATGMPVFLSFSNEIPVMIEFV
jgi:hypothetical protein